jgi:eukaryotic-like serine/threonine-protein kinase
VSVLPVAPAPVGPFVRTRAGRARIAPPHYLSVTGHVTDSNGTLFANCITMLYKKGIRAAAEPPFGPARQEPPATRATPMPPDTSAPQQLGNYDIVSKIADGGMGTVYKARNRITGEIVAVKVIAPATARNPIILQRFEREFVAAKVLDHPNVVKAIEYCGSGPTPFLVMEYVDGESLGQWVERKGAFPEAEAVRLIAQVCEGLQRAHKQGLVHRDVKPDNILVTRDGLAKLTDMGLVKDVEGDLNLTKTGRGLGTPHYMAPEQFKNAKTVDVRGDIYALGATLYALVTGRVPFENAGPYDCFVRKIRMEFPPPKELNPAVSDRVDWAIRRAMSAEPDRRPSSCREFLEDLTGQSRAIPNRPGAVPPAPAAAGADLWYMVYKDETGTTHTVKGSTEGIRNALRDQTLGDPAAVLVSRTKTGQFVPLMSVPEFRDLVVNPAPLAPGAPRPAAAGLVKASGVIATPLDRPRRADGDAPGPGTPRSGTVGGAAANRADRPPSPPPSKLHQVPPVAQDTPPTTSPAKRTPAPLLPPDPRPAINPQAETEPYVPTMPDPTGEQQAPEASPAEPAKAGPGQPFDWTPILVALVLALSAAVGYLLFSK